MFRPSLLAARTSLEGVNIFAAFRTRVAKKPDSVANMRGWYALTIRALRSYFYFTVVNAVWNGTKGDATRPLRVMRIVVGGKNSMFHSNIGNTFVVHFLILCSKNSAILFY